MVQNNAYYYWINHTHIVQNKAKLMIGFLIKELIYFLFTIIEVKSIKIFQLKQRIVQLSEN